MTPRGQVARKWRCWSLNPGLSQLDHMLFAQSHGVAGDGVPVLALETRLPPSLEESRVCSGRGGPSSWRIKHGMNKWS